MLRVHPDFHWTQIRCQNHRKGNSHAFQGKGKGTCHPIQLASEIEIHKSVKSEYVVKYERSFEDAANVYIILELCTNQVLPIPRRR